MALSLALAFAFVFTALTRAAPTPAPVQIVQAASKLLQVNSPVSDWAAGEVTEYPIHRSCNGSETLLLRQGLSEAEILASHAKDHIMRYGNSSALFLKYFGKATTAEPAGWFDKIVNYDKAGVLFRCDDPDHNCATQDGWAGHWRGSNATDESVICELSFTIKWPLAGMCSYGYSVAGSPTTAYFASDLIHRLFHTDKVGEGVVGHYADDYPGCLRLAVDNPAEAVRNSATLRYFALDVYAYDIAVPGQGCTGEPLESEDDHPAHGLTEFTASSSASPAAASASLAVFPSSLTTEAISSVTPAADQETATQTKTAASVGTL